MGAAMTEAGLFLLDLLLVLTLLCLAWWSLAATDLFKGIVLFIAFGLVLALAWVRLDAPDVALAEAAIGAGLTGALLLTTLSKLASSIDNPPAKRSSPVLLWVLLVMLAAVLGYAIMSLPQQAQGLADTVASQMGNSGVEHPVTAVLLNFRGYDTLLEMAVLLLALIAAWSLAPRAATSCEMDEALTVSPIVLALFRMLIPLMILVAAYLLWVGAHAPGGAFQAGSVLAAAGVLALLCGKRLEGRLAGWPLRLGLVLGTAMFVAVAAAVMVGGAHLLQYPLASAGKLILLIEAAATFSIGLTLAMLFSGQRPSRGPAS